MADIETALGRLGRDFTLDSPKMSTPSHFLPIQTAEDRSLALPSGAVIRTGYVHVDQVRLACRARMAVGDVDRSYQRRLQLGDRQPWPCPRGHWADGRFVIVDGRHDFIACLMLGLEYLLVAWPEIPAAPSAKDA